MTFALVLLVTYAIAFICGALAGHLRTTNRLPGLRQGLTIPSPAPDYRLADDLTVPLIEVVLDAERRANPGRMPRPPKGPAPGGARPLPGTLESWRGQPRGTVLDPPVEIRSFDHQLVRLIHPTQETDQESA